MRTEKAENILQKVPSTLHVWQDQGVFLYLESSLGKKKKKTGKPQYTTFLFMD